MSVYSSFAKICDRKPTNSFFTANSILKFRFEEHDWVNVVTHQEDLEDLFPDVDIDVDIK